MAHNLPDELLREILGPSLLVPDVLFADCGSRSPFSKTAISASRILLVCKRWMRVCTPWLYETVVIRSKAQAASLARALTRNPSFGSFIKKLRVEGGFDVSAVVGVSPNIIDLCFSLAIWSNDDEAGIVSILEYVNPRRVILTTHQAVSNAKFDQVLLTFCIMIGRWTRLERFVFPEYSPTYRRRGLNFYYVGDDDMASISDALAQREEPTVVILHIQYIGRVINHYPARPVLAALDPNVAISSILVTGIKNWVRTQPWKDALPPGLRAITRDAQEAEPQNVMQPKVPASTVGATVDLDSTFINPFYEPLKTAAPADRKLILTKIISFACEHDGHFSHATPWYDTSVFENGTARSLRRVGREFEHLTSQMLCAHVRLGSGSVANFRDVLDRHPDCGALVQTLTSSLVSDDLASIIPRCSNIREISVGMVPSRVQRYASSRRNGKDAVLESTIVSLVAQTTGQTLKRLTFSSLSQDRIDAAVFNGFPVLRSLCWGCSFTLSPASIPVALPQLETLELLSTTHNSFVDALADFSLPALTELQYRPHDNDCEAFLLSHGSKVKTVVAHRDWGERLLELAPNIETLTLDTIYSDSRAFANQSHSNLHTIILHWYTDKHHIPEWKHLAKALTASVASSGRRARKSDTPAAYPALRTVKAVNLSGWPASEREISKSPWPAIAETLLKQGIALLDRNDCGWRPRL